MNNGNPRRPDAPFSNRSLTTTTELVLTHGVMATSSLVLVAAAAAEYYRRSSSNSRGGLIPRSDEAMDGKREVERFSHYVARQLGFSDPNDCPQLCKLAYQYLTSKSSAGCEDNIYDYFAGGQGDAKQLCGMLVLELERCILSYFAFHWDHASSLVTQIMNGPSEKKRKLKNVVLAATRERRFERVSKSLKMTRVFSNLVEEMKAIRRRESHVTDDVMVSPAATVSDRSPVLLFMGGGMGAGKSTVINDILKESFWGGAAANAVVVEADAFKESDVIFKALNSTGHHDDMLPTAELVHQASIDAASSLLVTALNEGRDVIMDGTLSWEPFVEQTIQMARDVHKRRYRMGVGYKAEADGTSVTENYWEPVEEDEQNDDRLDTTTRRPYRIEMVGVVCDAYLAVVRGIRRAIVTGRAVRVNSQLISHKRFANAFPNYCQLVDNARLYSTNTLNGPPKLIARKDGENKMLIDQEGFKWLSNVGTLNPSAESVHELYSDPSLIDEPGSVWKDVVFNPSRPSIQAELRMSIKRIETLT
ncbi:Calmodulin calcium-dependent NAD kinase [Linum grandiflorum]